MPLPRQLSSRVSLEAANIKQDDRHVYDSPKSSGLAIYGLTRQYLDDRSKQSVPILVLPGCLVGSVVFQYVFYGLLANMMMSLFVLGR
jgi:hypothetical protein